MKRIRNKVLTRIGILVLKLHLKVISGEQQILKKHSDDGFVKLKDGRDISLYRIKLQEEKLRVMEELKDFQKRVGK